MPGALRPALLNSTSMRPNASFVFANSAFTDSGLLTSVGTASASLAVRAGVPDGLLQQFLAATCKRDAIAVFQQRERRSLADAGAGAGDDGDPVVRVHGSVSLGRPVTIATAAHRGSKTKA